MATKRMHRDRDIDDDEDDWAPETIEWNDGTKINLAQVEASTPTTEQLAGHEKPKQAKQPETAEAKPATTRVTSIGPKATVLKLGSSLQPKPAPPNPDAFWKALGSNPGC